MTGDLNGREDDDVREYDTIAQTEASEISLREQAEVLANYGASIHNLIDRLEDSLFEPVPRDFAGPSTGKGAPQSVGQNVRQARRLMSSADDRLNSLLSRL